MAGHRPRQAAAATTRGRPRQAADDGQATDDGQAAAGRHRAGAAADHAADDGQATDEGADDGQATGQTAAATATAEEAAHDRQTAHDRQAAAATAHEAADQRQATDDAAETTDDAAAAAVVDELTVVDELSVVFEELVAGQVAHERKVVERVTEALHSARNGSVGRTARARRQSGKGAGRAEREAQGCDNGTPLRHFGQGSPFHQPPATTAGCSAASANAHACRNWIPMPQRQIRRE